MCRLATDLSRLNRLELQRSLVVLGLRSSEPNGEGIHLFEDRSLHQVLYQREAVSPRHDISYLAAFCSSHNNRMYKRGHPTPSYEMSSYSVFGQAMRL
jgi:hypothetical protein